MFISSINVSLAARHLSLFTQPDEPYLPSILTLPNTTSPTIPTRHLLQFTQSDVLSFIAKLPNLIKSLFSSLGIPSTPKVPKIVPSIPNLSPIPTPSNPWLLYVKVMWCFNFKCDFLFLLLINVSQSWNNMLSSFIICLVLLNLRSSFFFFVVIFDKNVVNYVLDSVLVHWLKQHILVATHSGILFLYIYIYWPLFKI